MKKLIIAIIAVCSFGVVQNADAQRVTISIQGGQPDWGPYSYSQASFYYIPEMDVYYDIANRLFYYLNGNAWVHARNLPSRYSRYDLYKVYKQPISGSRPWLRNKQHRNTYGQIYRDRGQQVTFRDKKNNSTLRGNQTSGRGNSQSSRGNNHSSRGNSQSSHSSRR